MVDRFFSRVCCACLCLCYVIYIRNDLIRIYGTIKGVPEYKNADIFMQNLNWSKFMSISSYVFYSVHPLHLSKLNPSPSPILESVCMCFMDKTGYIYFNKTQKFTRTMNNLGASVIHVHNISREKRKRFFFLFYFCTFSFAYLNLGRTYI